VTRGGSDGTDDLEVIDLEPEDPATPRQDTATAIGVRRRRWPAVIAIVVVTALVSSAIVNRSHGSSRKKASTSTTPAGESVGAPLFPFRVGAQILTGGASGLRIIDTDTGRVASPRITGLPPGPVSIVAHSGGTVAVRANARLYWFSMHYRTAHYSEAMTAFPAVHRGSLWLASPRSATEVPGAPDAVRTDGTAIGATRGGLLVTTEAGVLLQPTGRAGVTRLLLRAPAVVIGVHPDRVAWVSNECGVLRCPVHVTEIASGASSSWLQLVGHPGPLAVELSSAVFSPGGHYLAIVVPDNSVTRAQTLVVADLRSRATTITDARGRFDEPARPGSADATGVTVDWTLDGRFLLLAPASGTGPVRAIDPRPPLGLRGGIIVPSRGPMGLIATAAAIGASTAGPLDYPRHDNSGPIDSGGPTPFGSPGLSLVGADDQQVDVLDLDTNRIRTWPVGGVVPNPAGPSSVARVTGGWLVVRGGVVDLVTDDGGTERAGFVDAGSLVFSSNQGRDAWIAVVSAGLQWRVEPYDPATGALGPATIVGTPVGAVDKGLLVTGNSAFGSTELDFVDRSGRLQGGPIIDSTRINVLATAGRQVAFVGSGGLYLLDLVSGTDRLITPRALHAVALSADGTVIAWIEDDPNNPTTRPVLATRVDGTRIAKLGGPADRVLVADDGTVLFTSGVEVRSGRVDANGSTPVYGLAPDPGASLAIAYRPPPVATTNFGPHFLP
jgi:hypothetical protein